MSVTVSESGRVLSGMVTSGRVKNPTGRVGAARLGSARLGSARVGSCHLQLFTGRFGFGQVFKILQVGWGQVRRFKNIMEGRDGSDVDSTYVLFADWVGFPPDPNLDGQLDIKVLVCFHRLLTGKG